MPDLTDVWSRFLKASERKYFLVSTPTKPPIEWVSSRTKIMITGLYRRDQGKRAKEREMAKTEEVLHHRTQAQLPSWSSSSPASFWQLHFVSRPCSFTLSNLCECQPMTGQECACSDESLTSYNGLQRPIHFPNGGDRPFLPFAPYGAFRKWKFAM